MNQYNFLINGPVFNEFVDTIRNVLGSGLDIVRIIVTGMAIIALLILSIKYFTETPTGKSEQKNALPDYIIGIVLFVGATYILTFLMEFISTVLSKI